MDANKVLELSIDEAYGGPTSATVVDITDSETSYTTCGTCLILRSGCVEHNGHFDGQRSLMPRAEGKLYLDALGASASDRIVEVASGQTAARELSASQQDDRAEDCARSRR